MWVGYLIGAASRRAGRGAGTQISGQVMLKLNPQLPRRLAVGGPVVTLVSATNGKSAITSMLCAAIDHNGGRAISNDFGGNMMPGMLDALARASKANATHVVLETDEAVLPRAIAELEPAVVVLGELSRDQLDRHFEVRSVAAKWRMAFATGSAPEVPTFIAPVGDPNVVWSVEGHDAVWVDTGTMNHLDNAICPACDQMISAAPNNSAWHCACGRTSPVATIVREGEALTVDGEHYETTMVLQGGWQHANRALAVAGARTLGIPVAVALAASAQLDHVGTRPNTFRTSAGVDTRLVLVKNPSGWRALIDDLEHGSGTVVIAQNDNGADGRDPSWLWDVPFERLAPRNIVATGTRARDVAVRVSAAGLNVKMIPDLYDAIDRAAPAFVSNRAAIDNDAIIAASYTAYHDIIRQGKRR